MANKKYSFWYYNENKEVIAWTELEALNIFLAAALAKEFLIKGITAAVFEKIVGFEVSELKQ